MVRSTPALGAIVLIALAPLAGCSSPVIGGKKGFSTANDELRARNTALEADNRRLLDQNQELTAALAREQRVRDGLITPEVLAAIPQCAGIELSSLSGVHPFDTAKPAESIVLYIQPFDGQHRFVQIVGTLRAQALANSSDAGSGGEPSTIASTILTPALVRSAYRSGITGTHYSIELPLSGESAIAARMHALLLSVQFEDAITGQVHETTMKVAQPATRR